MDKKEYVRRIADFRETYGLTDPSEIVVISGGSMLVRGLRQSTNDIDGFIRPSLFDRLVEEGRPTFVDYGVIHVRIEEYDMDLTTSTTQYEIVEGIACQTLAAILGLKLSLNREKDQADIRLIRGILGQPE